MIPDVPAPEPFGVGDGEAETVLLNGSVVAAPPSVPERKEKILCHYISRNEKKSHSVIHVYRKN